ncbi:MAG: ferrous iron transport protein A [Thermoplasmata archaeon]|nr:MAG: ferrous iron transport protein A [Thermoplasmata archaeon]RLF50085.1 MAG: ferrous iron transport protein A [Thermoplasmata archaeon]
MMLTQLRPNEIARVVAIEGGYGIRQKLALRGIVEGAIIRVVSCHGPITVEVNRNLVCIGRGMARRIMVERV